MRAEKQAFLFNDDPVLPKGHVLRSPNDDAIVLKSVKIFFHAGFPTLDEGGRNPASPAPERHYRDISLVIHLGKFFPGLICNFKTELAHAFPSK